MTKRIASLAALAATLTFAQGGVNKTTLSQAVDGSQSCFTVASTTNLTPGMFGYADKEAVLLMSVSSATSTVCVLRGQNATKQASHVNATPFFVGTSQDWATLGATPQEGPESIGATIASAGTITAPSLMFKVSGTTTINTINLPPGFFGGCLTVIPTGTFATGTSGNIALASTAVVSKALRLCYDPNAAKFYPSY